MKKILSVALGFFIAVTLTGCLTVDSNIKLNEDGETGEITTKVLYDKELNLYSLSGVEDENEFFCEKIIEDKEVDQELITIAETEKNCIYTLTEEFFYDQEGVFTYSDRTERDPFIPQIDENLITITTDKNIATVAIEANIFDMNFNVADYSVTVEYPGEVKETTNRGVTSENGKSVTWVKKDFKQDKAESSGSLVNHNWAAYSVGGFLALILTILFFAKLGKKRTK